MTHQPNLLAAMVCGAALLAGCGSNSKFDTIPIKGTVTYKGKPLTKGIVTYLPAKSGVGRTANGPLDANGAFIMTTHAKHDGVAPGDYNIVVFCYDESSEAPQTREEREAKGQAFKQKSLIPEKYTNPATSGLTDTVDDNHSGVKQIELTD